MSYLITHHFEGATQEQYDAITARVHPAGGLPAGQLHHFAGPSADGFLVVAVWESKELNDESRPSWAQQSAPWTILPRRRKNGRRSSPTKCTPDVRDVELHPR